MSEDEIGRANAEYFQLRLKYCDLAVLLSSIKRNLKDVESKTGSRIQGDSSVLNVIEAGGGRMRSGSDYYGLLLSQLRDRLELIQEIGEFEEMETDPERVNLRELERRVNERIASFK